MRIALNQTTFRRLLQFYVVAFVAAFLAILPEYLLAPWPAFSEDFDALVVQHFGEVAMPDWMLMGTFAVVVALFIWLVASVVGLFRFRRWARFGFWASTVPMFVLFIGMAGLTPSYSSPIGDVIGLIESALFGAIVLMSYADGLGAEWFSRPPAA